MVKRDTLKTLWYRKVKIKEQKKIDQAKMNQNKDEIAILIADKYKLNLKQNLKQNDIRDKNKWPEKEIEQNIYIEMYIKLSMKFKYITQYIRKIDKSSSIV